MTKKLNKPVPLGESSRMKILQLVGLRINLQGWKALKTGLKYSNTIEEIKINIIKIDQQALGQLADAMMYNKSLAVLDLSYCDLADEDAHVLSQVISYQR